MNQRVERGYLHSAMKPSNIIRISLTAVLTGFLMSAPVSADPALLKEAMELDRQDTELLKKLLKLYILVIGLEKLVELM